jgi:hypothetical protein
MSETEDLSKIARLGDVVASPALRAVLKEVHPLAQLVVLWQNVPTSGSAVCRYNTGAGTRSYEIRYQYGDIGNLVHELTLAVNEAYELDFINYSSPNWNSPTLPARQYDTVGHCRRISGGAREGFNGLRKKVPVGKTTGRRLFGHPSAPWPAVDLARPSYNQRG